MPEQVNIDTFCIEISTDRVASMECLITSDSIYEIELEIEKILQMPLNIQNKSILEDHGRYVNVDNEKSVQIYQKI